MALVRFGLTTRELRLGNVIEDCTHYLDYLESDCGSALLSVVGEYLPRFDVKTAEKRAKLNKIKLTSVR